MLPFAWTLLLLPIAADAAGPPASEPIEVPSMLIKLIEQVEVPAQETGVLAAVPVAEGQAVQQGSLLAQIDDSDARIAAQRCQGELEIARANAKNDVNIRYARKSIEVAKAELRRASESVKTYAKSVSDSELDRLRLLVEKSTLEAEQAQHDFTIAGFTLKLKESDYDAARQKIERYKVLAPLSGVVVQVQRHRGEWVKPGDVVMRLVRMDRLRAEGFVKARFVGQDLRAGQVKLTVDLPGRPAMEFPAKIVFVDPEIDPVNAQVRVWAEVQNTELRLRPGMRAKMTIQVPPSP
jgi:multidrug efflux pump subunit AcrA (membrane-fusion protein)